MILDAKQMQNLWVRNGGDPARALVMISIARAESGWESTIVSPSDDHGLWQINRDHFSEYGVNDSTVLDIDTNCRIAISLSGNGFNVAPWCTCWQNPGVNCGNGLLRDPQPGTPAALEIPLVAAALSVAVPSDPAPVQATQTSDVHAAWEQLGETLGPWADNMLGTAHGIGTAAKGLIR